eukprot:TRINITY_DN71107_c0_g1_i2.p1 TRINITY_DN71107_c0_g1~~TRINITY_DN71107_c0_g1_i2.p1  ORF type:complete len:167 (+),score=4.10 TRINITY_DN71107_c0_g1_i2:71-502(+)
MNLHRHCPDILTSCDVGVYFPPTCAGTIRTIEGSRGSRASSFYLAVIGTNGEKLRVTNPGTGTTNPMTRATTQWQSTGTYKSIFPGASRDAPPPVHYILREQPVGPPKKVQVTTAPADTPSTPLGLASTVSKILPPSLMKNFL